MGPVSGVGKMFRRTDANSFEMLREDREKEDI